MFATHEIIERLSLTAPFGARFWDEVSGKIIGDSLVVEAYPLATPYRRVRAFTTVSGVYVLRDLPGLRDLENGLRDDEFQQGTYPTRPFVIEVTDTQSRFLPFSFTVDMPVRGLFRWDDPVISPPENLPGVPLFSAPTRSAPAAMAAIRADLLEPNGTPAAWAVIEARSPEGKTVRGMADGQGRIALLFPYPEPVMDSIGSPPDSGMISPPAGGRSLKEQEWNIELRAFYSPASSVPVMADLRAALSQAEATLWSEYEMFEMAEATLRFGQELILRSRNPVDGSEESFLLIEPAVSPP